MRSCYQSRTGCQWRDDGTVETSHDLLRWQVREMRRRHEDPTAAVLDSQTVRA